MLETQKRHLYYILRFCDSANNAATASTASTQQQKNSAKFTFLKAKAVLLLWSFASTVDIYPPYAIISYVQNVCT